MSPLRSAWRDYREALPLFTRAARLFLLTELLAWTCHGVFAVLFNLYLVEAGYRESFVGRAIAANGLGIALAALPAGWLAERWGRRRALLLGVALDAVSQFARVTFAGPEAILGWSFLAGAGQALLAIAAPPFLAEHSSARERTHLFSTFFAVSLMAGVLGSVLGGEVPRLLAALPEALRPDRLGAYRGALWLAALLNAAAALPLLRLRGLEEAPAAPAAAPAGDRAGGTLVPIAVTSFLIGAGAGLVIPFMNLYFSTRFACSSSQIGLFFSLAQVFTACAALLGPAFARRYGMLRAAVAAQVLSLPFLVTLGLERRLEVAVAAFWARATLMQASTPLVQNFVMEALPPARRARASSLIHLVWNIGWAVSATSSGLVIQHFGYAVPFYLTAGLYAVAALNLYLAFRGRAARGGAEALRAGPPGASVPPSPPEAGPPGGTP